MKREYAIALQAGISAVGAWLSNKLGILYPVLCLLFAMMVIDYATGMLASKAEAIDHPNDPKYGWSSKKGAKGIIKKAGYCCVIVAAIILDYIILKVGSQLGFQIPSSAFFGLLVTVWYILNEMLSVLENAGRMGADLPDWLRNYISVLRDKIDNESMIKEEKHS